MKTRIITSVVFVIITIIFINEMWQQQQNSDLEKILFTLEYTDVYLEGEEISALLITEDSLWVGGKDGIKSIDYITGEVIGYVLDDIQLIYAADIVVSNVDNSIWIGHNEGVSILYENGDRTDFSTPEMSAGRTNSILETAHGIYVGTMQGCTLFTYKNETWKVTYIYKQSNGLASNPVNTITEIDGEIWFGSYLDSNPGGVSILDVTTNQFQYLDIQSGLPHPYINAILPIGHSVYIATGQLTFGGLVKVDKIEDIHMVTDLYDTNDHIPGEKVRQLYLDSKEYVWITTESNGLIVASGIEQVSHPINGIVIDEDNGLSDNEIKCIVETNTHYWLGGRYGLTRILKETITDLVTNHSVE
ncbi:MAG: hypothetical protein R3Y54_02350 [Eubacteriales bacterium]